MKLAVLRIAGLVLLLGTAAVGPFFQGLFFPYQQHPAEVAVGLGVLLWLLGRPRTAGRLVDWRDPPTLAAVALVAFYLLASLRAVYPQGQLEVVLRLLAVLLAFVALRAEAAVHPRLTRVVALVVAGAGIAEALFSLAPFVGISRVDPEMVKALTMAGANSRLNSSFQYPNTAAIFFVATVLIIAGLALSSEVRPLRFALAAAAGFAPMLAFVLAASRGALLVMPVAVAALLVGLPRGRRLPALLLLLAAALPALAATRGFAGNAALHDVPRVLKWYGAGQLAAALGGLVLALWVRLPVRARLAVTAGVAAAALLGGGWMASRDGGIAGAVQRVLPGQVQRMADISWRTNNALLRLYYDRDALRILRDRPLLGAGGRGWERLSFQYQDFYYYATETHDGFMQTAVEAGVPGLLALAGFAVAVGVSGWRRRGEGADGALVWSLSSAALTLLAHSWIDFNLSYLSILMLVWVLAAVAAPPPTATGQAPEARAEGKSWRPGLLALVALFTLVAATQAYAAQALERGNGQWAAGKQAAATASFAQAARWAPLAPAPRERLAQAHAGEPVQVVWLQQAIRRDRHNVVLANKETDLYTFRKDQPATVAAALRAVALQPAYYENYERAMAPLMEMGIAEILEGKRADGLGRAEQAQRLGAELLARRERTAAQKDLWPDAQPSITPVIQLRYGQALALLGRPEEALPYLQAARSARLPIDADVWTFLVLQKLGRPIDPELARRPWILWLHANPVRNILG